MPISHHPDRPAVITQGGCSYYRASSLGSPACQLWYARHNVIPPAPPPAPIQDAYDYGHANEQRALEHLESLGWNVYGKQVGFAHKLTPKIIVTGTVDGLADRTKPDKTLDFTRVVEVKWLNQANFTAFQKKGFAGLASLGEKYSIQLALYLDAFAYCEALYCVGNKGYVESPTVDPASEYYICTFTRGDLPSPNTLKARILRLEAQSTRPDPPTCPSPYPYSCPYYHTHVTREEPESDPRLVTLLNQYDSCRRVYDRDKTNLEDVRRQIVSHFNDTGKKKLRITKSVHPYTIQSVTTTRTTTDQEALQSLLKQYNQTIPTTTTTTTSVRITPAKEK